MTAGPIVSPPVFGAIVTLPVIEVFVVNIALFEPVMYEAVGTEIVLFDTAEITPFWSNVIDGIDVELPTVVEVIVPATLITANEAFVNGIMVYLL
jgi:hypothetical protein